MTPAQTARRLNEFRRDLPLLVGNEVVNFALDNWDKQGWQGATFKPWPQRKSPPSGGSGGGSILVGKQSGRLRRSQRITRRTARHVEVGSELEYAGIHNEGGQIRVTVTAKSRRFFWAMYYQTGNDMWKGMALTKKTQLTITMPERRFIGESPVLDEMIRTVIENRLQKILS